MNENNALASPSTALWGHNGSKAAYRVTLVRHGETYQNRNQVVQGQDPSQGRLTPEGMRQAQLLAIALRERPFDIVYCSPLERAVLTMALLLVPRAGDRTLPIRFLPELMEINQGVLHGKSHVEWKAAMVGHDPMAFSAADGESWLDVQARVTRCLREAILPAGYPNILIVAHGGVNRGMLASLTGLSMAEAWRGAGQGCPQDNTCVNHLELDAAGNLLSAVVNDSSHLAGEFPFATPGQRWHATERRWEVLGAPDKRHRNVEFNPYG
ncbi:MAG: histidine phosphatase family protein [Deltaproteobacteria bacterium]|nr:histidine phosphatase family protein [Deltaproteobacteria bacterium]